jgi:hypothetical protein
VGELQDRSIVMASLSSLTATMDSLEVIYGRTYPCARSNGLDV